MFSESGHAAMSDQYLLPHTEDNYVQMFPNAEISKCGGFISFRMQRTAAAAAGLMSSS